MKKRRTRKGPLFIGSICIVEGMTGTRHVGKIKAPITKSANHKAMTNEQEGPPTETIHIEPVSPLNLPRHIDVTKGGSTEGQMMMEVAQGNTTDDLKKVPIDWSTLFTLSIVACVSGQQEGVTEDKEIQEYMKKHVNGIVSSAVFTLLGKMKENESITKEGTRKEIRSAVRGMAMMGAVENHWAELMGVFKGVETGWDDHGLVNKELMDQFKGGAEAIIDAVVKQCEKPWGASNLIGDITGKAKGFG